MTMQPPRMPAREASVPYQIEDDPKRLATWEYCLEVKRRWDEWERRENIRVPTNRELYDIFAERGIYEG